MRGDPRTPPRQPWWHWHNWLPNLVLLSFIVLMIVAILVGKQP